MTSFDTINEIFYTPKSDDKQKNYVLSKYIGEQMHFVDYDKSFLKDLPKEYKNKSDRLYLNFFNSEGTIIGFKKKYNRVLLLKDDGNYIEFYFNGNFSSTVNYDYIKTLGEISNNYPKKKMESFLNSFLKKLFKSEIEMGPTAIKCPCCLNNASRNGLNFFCITCELAGKGIDIGTGFFKEI